MSLKPYTILLRNKTLQVEHNNETARGQAG
jgi:hypothetical protein